jgi:hypothetical protein
VAGIPFVAGLIFSVPSGWSEMKIWYTDLLRDVRWRFFFGVVKVLVFAGFFKNMGGWRGVFDGENAVDCVVKLVS